jgi:selenium metabolism protein YedF
MPVVQAKRALERSEIGSVKVKVDNFIAVQNLQKMADGLGFEFEYNKISDSEFDVVLVKHGHDALPDLREPDMGSRDGFFVVAIGSDTMGRGSEELGRVLMKSFIYSLTELDKRPDALLFYNSGAFFTSAESSSLGDLQALADSGTSILTCGACVDFYKLPQPAVGAITNMFEIAGTMSKAHRLITL